MLSLVLSFLGLFWLKPFHIEAIVDHIDNGAVSEVDAIVLVIDTGDEIAVLVELTHEDVIGSGVEDAAQLCYRLPGKKQNTSLFALFSIRFALPFALLNVDGTSGKKSKNFVICFVFHSVCTTFANEFEVRVSR